MSIMILVASILGVLAAIVGVVQSRKGAAWGKPVALLGAAVALWFSAQRLMQPSPQELRFRQTERLAFVAGEQLGEHLAAQYGAARAVVFTRPTEEDLVYTSDESSSVAGLRTGLQTGFDTVELTALPSHKDHSQDDAARMDYLTMDAEDWVDWDKVEALLKTAATPEEMVIFTIPPPPEFFQALSTAPEPKVKVGLLSGSPGTIFSLIETGAVHAAVLMSPNPEPIPEIHDEVLDSRAAFDRMFLLVTGENLAATRADYPEAFGP